MNFRVRVPARLAPPVGALLLMAGAAGLLAPGCGSGKTATPAGAGKPAAVVVVPVAQFTVPVYSEYVATIDADETVEIRARVEAYLLSQHFEEGRLVRKGQILFTLDSRRYEADFQLARAALAKAQADLRFAQEKVTIQRSEAELAQSKAWLTKSQQDVARLKPLAEQQAVPQQDYDNALATLQVAQADVTAKQASLDTTVLNQQVSVEQARAAVAAGEADIARAQLNLDYCRIASPIDGVIGRRLVAPGNLVGRGDATVLATISDLDPLRVTFSLSETDYLKLAKYNQLESGHDYNTPLELILADGSVYPHQGRLIIAERALDPKTGTLPIIGEFKNPDLLLRPGQFGRVRFISAGIDNALLVPQRAVMELQSAKTVYIVGPSNKVALRTVVLGPRFRDLVVVSEGVKAGERVIVEGTLKVRPGMAVAPAEKPLSAEPGAR